MRTGTTLIAGILLLPGLPLAAARAQTDMGDQEMGSMKMTASKMPQLREKRVVTVTGDEDWKVRTGFGKNGGMVAMMNGMMVEGTGLDKMKMAVMKMDFGDRNFTEDAGERRSVATAPPATVTPDAPKPAGDDMTAAASPGPAPVETRPAAPSPTRATPVAADLKITGKVDGSPKVGDNRFLITVMDGKGQPVTGAGITASVAMTSMDMGTTKPAVKEIGKGVYRTIVNLAMQGPWRVTVTVAGAPGRKPAIKNIDVTVK